MMDNRPSLLPVLLVLAGCSSQVDPSPVLGTLSVTADFPVLANVEYVWPDSRCGQTNTDLDCFTGKAKAVPKDVMTFVAQLESGQYYLRLSCRGYRAEDTASVPQHGGGNQIGLGYVPITILPGKDTHQAFTDVTC